LKYLLTLIVCALLTVGLILCVKLSIVQGDWVKPDWTVGVGLILIMALPLVILFATIWAVIGFTKTVNRWIAENQVDDCPHHLSTRTAAERDKANEEYNEAKWQKENLCPGCKRMWANCNCFVTPK